MFINLFCARSQDKFSVFCCVAFAIKLSFYYVTYFLLNLKRIFFLKKNLTLNWMVFKHIIESLWIEYFVVVCKKKTKTDFHRKLPFYARLARFNQFCLQHLLSVFKPKFFWDLLKYLNLEKCIHKQWLPQNKFVANYNFNYYMA